MNEFGSGLLERVWYGADALAGLTRMALVPAETLFAATVGVRDLLYDTGWLSSHEPIIPAVSVGNLTVGGTGKTPVAAWIAAGLQARGAKPAIILRGYGADEPLVHQRLNPTIPVVLDADRLTAAAEASRLGADIAVLDDAFQHRRARRVADIVLVGADRWTGNVHLLPAGPWREPLKAVRRATLVIVTRKAATDRAVESVHERLSSIAPGIPRVSVKFELGELVDAVSGATQPLDVVSEAPVRAVLSIADPRAFVRQLEQRGARVTAVPFPDHHVFAPREIEHIAAGAGDAELIVCTLKDAVKLGPRWPRLAPPLYYVSQHVTVERGVGGVERLLDDLVHARGKTPSTAG